MTPSTPQSPQEQHTNQKTTTVHSAWGVVVILLIGAVIVCPIVYFFIWPSHVRSQLLANGIQAQGTITAIRPTGNYMNNQPEAAITVTIQPAQGEPFQAETRMIVNPLYSPQFQPGKSVLVRYDQNDRTKMTIEYTQNP